MSKTRSNAARTLAQARWEGKTPEERTRQLKEWCKLGGRPKSAKRCFCGQQTMRRAADRYFECCRAVGVVELHLEKANAGNEGA